jgi:predicted nucleic acid-binding protein
MTARVFVDTNVWVYAVDGAEPAKQARAREVLTPANPDALVVSAQVLGEFYMTVTRKLAPPVAAADAERMVEHMARLPLVEIDSDRVAAAIAGSQTWQVSYWDALILVAAKAAGCATLLSEDLAAGTRYGDVVVENPFASPHQLSEVIAPFTVRPSSWADTDLSAELARYEQAARDVAMRPNAIHSYWDYARRFLDWRTGDYRPRGATTAGRPVPPGPATADELAQQASTYAAELERAGREPATIETYHRHAMFFVRWLRGDFQPGARLRKGRERIQ